jgi:hypothetical protein
MGRYEVWICNGAPLPLFWRGRRRVRSNSEQEAQVPIAIGSEATKSGRSTRAGYIKKLLNEHRTTTTAATRLEKMGALPQRKTVGYGKRRL